MIKIIKKYLIIDFIHSCVSVISLYIIVSAKKHILFPFWKIYLFIYLKSSHVISVETYSQTVIIVKLKQWVYCVAANESFIISTHRCDSDLDPQNISSC